MIPTEPASGGLARQLRRFTPTKFTALLRWINLRLRVKDMQAPPFWIGRGFHLHVQPGAKIRGCKSLFIDRHNDWRIEGELIVGDNVRFAPKVTLSVHDKIVIGANSQFAECVSVHDNTHVGADNDVPFHFRPRDAAPIIVGENVWVGAKATILMGVTIGDNVVIGANAVVTRDIPPGVIVGGVPAKIIGQTVKTTDAAAE
ncbi:MULTISPECIES: acyltransferase [Mycobacteriaceae]|uniref:Acetyltransferase (Isoleucine patch superfamily) n=2 Tax=Mycolicibacterium fluoranthenivorans TaxID=258505 RepID=A0A1G4VW76_9MYCO|nr:MULTISPECIES: acyltransferase [Mycobacteriaceae]NIH94758.1 acetyltransferase-like isoleucine patch superfamily enzyme [Mycolicibacterium fluoranthenivorans]SCX12859.1 Acetyltransferase (isoleucine patch superfamily) [Mycolicibacterium fluoranthenivorans]